MKTFTGHILHMVISVTLAWIVLLCVVLHICVGNFGQAAVLSLLLVGLLFVVWRIYRMMLAREAVLLAAVAGILETMKKGREAK